MADNPVILITRPEPQASRFADEIRNEIGDRAEILVHPLSVRETLDVQMLSDDLILKDIAQMINMDISTVSRVANSKSVQTDFGIFPLK